MTNEQIVTLYESSGLTIDELSQTFELPHEVIKIALASRSAKFHKDIKKDKTLFDESALDEAVIVMRQCLYAEESSTKIRAAKFIINEAKGRHDVANVKNLNGINLNLINIHYQQALAAKNKAKGIQTPSVSQELIEV